jgi:hypothetical protein
MFGNSDLNFTDPPIVVIGGGFSLEQLKVFLNAISNQKVSIIAFAYPDDEGEETEEKYHKEILVGAYNTHKYGLSLEDAVELINKENIEISVFYSALMH